MTSYVNSPPRIMKSPPPGATVIRKRVKKIRRNVPLCLETRFYDFFPGLNHAQAVADEFLAHANEEQQHADQIAERIVQLGGEPDLSPQGLTSRSHSEYKEGNSLVEMMEEDLIAERIAIDSYREMIQYFGDLDPTTRRMLEGILAVEEEHAEELSSMLQNLPREEERARH